VRVAKHACLPLISRVYQLPHEAFVVTSQEGEQLYPFVYGVCLLHACVHIASQLFLHQESIDHTQDRHIPGTSLEQALLPLPPGGVGDGVEGGAGVGVGGAWHLFLQ